MPALPTYARSFDVSFGVASTVLVAFAVGSLLATTLATPVLAGAIALLYVDRRIRREGLDVTLAAAARQRSATPGQG